MMDRSGQTNSINIFLSREFPTSPQGGLIPPNFRTTPPQASGVKEGERGRGGRGKGKGRGEGKERDLQRLVDTPHDPNPVKYPVPACVCRTYSVFGKSTTFNSYKNRPIQIKILYNIAKGLLSLCTENNLYFA